jgi:hypothetical protein
MYWSFIILLEGVIAVIITYYGLSRGLRAPLSGLEWILLLGFSMFLIAILAVPVLFHVRHRPMPHSEIIPYALIMFTSCLVASLGAFFGLFWLMAFGFMLGPLIYIVRRPT